MKRLTMLTAATALTAMPRAFENTAASTPRVEPILTAAAKMTLPTRVSKRGSESKYPFDTLTEVGMAFGVKNKTAAQLSSIVSNQNRKSLIPVTDDNGNALYETKELTGADGAKTVVPDTSKPKTKPGKKFFAFDVTDEYRKANKDSFAKGAPFEGVNTLVFREI